MGRKEQHDRLMNNMGLEKKASAPTNIRRHAEIIFVMNAYVYFPFLNLIPLLDFCDYWHGNRARICHELVLSRRGSCSLDIL